MKKTNAAGNWLVQHTRRDMPCVLLLSVLNILTAVAYLWLALLSKELLEAAQELLKQAGTRAVWDCFRQPALYVPIAKVIGVVLGQVILYAVTGRLKVTVSGKLEMRLRNRVFTSLVHADYTAVHRLHTGELMTRLTSDISVVAQGVTGLLPTAASLAAKLIGGVAVLAALAPDLAVVIVGVGVMTVIGSRIYGSRLKQMHKRCQEAYGKTGSFMQEILSHLLSVKAFGVEKTVETAMNDRQTDHFRWKLRRNAVQLWGSTGMYLLMTAAYYVMLAWCVVCLAAGTMTVGTLTALLQVFDNLQSPLRNSSGLLPQYYAMMASAERLQQLDLLSAESQQWLFTDRQATVAEFRQLTLSHVSFAYDPSVPVLRDVNLEVRRGECVALVGTSGIGKSTLMKLVLALYPCDSGTICLEGKTTSLPVGSEARRLMAYVPQGNALISGTVRENIAFFREATEEQLHRVIQAACLEEYIASLPNGLDTLIGEHGLGVSEGQAQRIAVARALLSDAPLLLLDECTSALDAATEERLLNNLRCLQDKAVLLISHKNTTVAGCDCVWRLESGVLEPCFSNNRVQPV